ncbi:hypothetical protein [Actinomyces polynesiensis]|nr:hypothetical protein [Actinomyces polynesiensis]
MIAVAGRVEGCRSTPATRSVAMSHAAIAAASGHTSQIVELAVSATEFQ